MKPHSKKNTPSLLRYLSQKKSPFAWFDFSLVSGLGLGIIPLFPGFWGSLLGLFLSYALAGKSLPLHLFFLCALTFISAWRCEAVAETLKVPDHPNIVIDEVIGMWIATLFFLDLGFSTERLVASLLLFRILDMAKPGPIGWLDRNTKPPYAERGIVSQIPWKMGWGIILDDIAAGVLTGILIRGFGI